MPCWPRDCFRTPNLLPYSSLPNTSGTFRGMMPGPLSLHGKPETLEAAPVVEALQVYPDFGQYACRLAGV